MADSEENNFQKVYKMLKTLYGLKKGKGLNLEYEIDIDYAISHILRNIRISDIYCDRSTYLRATALHDRCVYR